MSDSIYAHINVTEYLGNSVLGWSALSGVVVVLVAYALNYPLLKYSLSVGMMYSDENEGFTSLEDFKVVLESKRHANECRQ